MYRPHSVLRTPPDETKLWRYLDLAEFLWLINENCLYFATLEELSDKWEGAWPTTFVMELERSTEFKRLIEEGVNEPHALQLVKDLRKGEQAGYAVNCWHQNEVESVAMWKLYTSGEDGVAVQTTVGTLKACLAGEARNVFIAAVEYSDHDGQQSVESGDAIVPVTRKRRAFRHESEVRVILDRGPMLGRQIASWVSGTLVSGEALSVNSAALIEGIVVAPTYPAWAVNSLQSQIEQRRIPVRIKRSDLLRLPDPDSMYRDLRESAGTKSGEER